ncbi:MAG: hypothetical protein DMG40_14465 [Acidobacteria bacterium]|nr:MAG: hypothetical protein DMG40_14465 [Acidobacteriota bacterium]
MHSVTQTLGVLATHQRCFRCGRFSIARQACEFPAVGHQFFEGERLFRSKFAFPAAHQAARFGYFVQPNHQSSRAVEFWQVRDRAQQHFLHGVFGVFPLAAHFHAEREDGVLQ